MPEDFLTVPENQELSPAFTHQPPTVVESMTRAEVDMQIATAKRYPRDYSVVKRKMVSLATLDEETAQSCFYNLSRQGKAIQGPSVRLAEIAASCFGNMRAAAQVVDNDGKTITARGICHDLESNSCFAVEVKRRITDKHGRTYSDDMQVVTGNAACAIALRNAIFKTVPFALIKPVYERAKQVAVGTIQTLTERRTNMLKAFAALGVNEGRILAAVGKPGIEDIGLAELETLIGLHTAIKDGDQNIDDAFPAVPSKPQFVNKQPAMTDAGQNDVTVAGTGDDPTSSTEGKPHGNSDAQASAPVQSSAPAPSNELPPLERLGSLLVRDGVSEEEMVEWAASKKMLQKGMTLDQLTAVRALSVVDQWEKWKPEIVARRA